MSRAYSLVYSAPYLLRFLFELAVKPNTIHKCIFFKSIFNIRTVGVAVVWCLVISIDVAFAPRPVIRNAGRIKKSAATFLIILNGDLRRTWRTCCKNFISIQSYSGQHFRFYLHFSVLFITIRLAFWPGRGFGHCLCCEIVSLKRICHSCKIFNAKYLANLMGICATRHGLNSDCYASCRCQRWASN